MEFTCFVDVNYNDIKYDTFNYTRIHEYKFYIYNLQNKVYLSITNILTNHLRTYTLFAEKVNFFLYLFGT